MACKNFLDWRNFFLLKIELQTQLVYCTATPIDIFFFNKKASYVNFYSSTLHSPNIKIFTVSSNDYFFGVLGLMGCIDLRIILVDSGVVCSGKLHTLVTSFSCLLTGERILLRVNLRSSLPSLQTILPAAVWVERELCEFNGYLLNSALDTRRLLTDYTQHSVLNSTVYKVNSYSSIVQDLYMWMLHWLFFFSFCILMSIASFFIFNNSLLHLILIGEVLVVLLVMLMAVISAYFNLYILIGLATLLLVFGGLELSLNLLFFSI